MHEMDMRHYDPAIARWVVQDPVLHYEYSPYQAFDNNPVFWADPSGADSWTNNGASNYYEYHGNVSFGMDETGFSASGSVVDSEKNDSNSDTESNNGDKPIGKNYNGKTQTAPATPLKDQNGKPNTNAYNCHSFAWCNSLGDPKDPANQILVKYGITKWDNDPTNNTGGHTPLKFSDPNKVGDRVIYYAWDTKSGKVAPTHSAIVTKIDQHGNTIEVESKWGEAPRFKHHPRDVPSSYGAKTPTFVAPDGKTYASRIYFRKNP